MFNSRALLAVLIFASTISGSLFAMSNLDEHRELHRPGDCDATYKYTVDDKGKRLQSVTDSHLFDFCDPVTKQLFDYVAKNNQEELKNLLDEAAIKGGLNINAELDGKRVLECAMLNKSYAAASILLSYGATLELVRCREHRALLRLLKIQADAVSAAPRSHARRRVKKRVSYSEPQGQSAPQSEDEKDDAQDGQEQDIGPINPGSRSHSQKAALLGDREPSEGARNHQAGAHRKSDGKADTGCSLVCSIQ